jgi:hypothetical protein
MPLLVAAAAAIAAAHGCGGGSGADSQVRATLQRFTSAVTRREYGVLCDELLASGLTAKLARIGLPCEQAMARGLGAVRRPALTVLSVSVHGSTASAVVRTSAANEAPSKDTIELLRSGESWRITSLGSAGP